MGALILEAHQPELRWHGQLDRLALGLDAQRLPPRSGRQVGLLQIVVQRELHQVVAIEGGHAHQPFAARGEALQARASTACASASPSAVSASGSSSWFRSAR